MGLFPITVFDKNFPVLFRAPSKKAHKYGIICKLFLTSTGQNWWILAKIGIWKQSLNKNLVLVIFFQWFDHWESSGQTTGKIGALLYFGLNFKKSRLTG